MLKINLLPESVRKVGPSRVEQLHRTPLMWIAAGLMVAVPVLLLLPIQMRQGQLRQLEEKIGMLEPKRAEVERLRQLLTKLRAEESAFRKMSTGQGLWSKRLNILSNLTPDGVWLTELALDQAKGLVMQGSAVSQADPEMVSVTRLVRDLEKDPDFSSAVKDIQIESLKRVPEGELEVVQFTLACALAEGGP